MADATSLMPPSPELSAVPIIATSSSSSSRRILQSDLGSLQCWERTWDMEFNPSKCPVLHISRSRSPIKSKYNMHSQELESEDSDKYLGVNISADLSWNSHISKITRTANRTLGFVNRNVNVTGEEKAHGPTGTRTQDLSHTVRAL